MKPQPPVIFAGFAQPTSNTTFTPNQFFDVCMRHCSRGTVRLVAFIIRKTLGWCDEQGNPQSERHTVSYADFEAAGISRSMIRQAVKEAVDGHFIRCIRAPQAKGLRREAVSGLYELRWDERGEYIKDPERFRGFFAGEGNRTYIPNQFFDHVVVSEKLAVVQVVGTVIRLSIGFANKWGHRRRNVALSLQHIKNYSRISDTKNVSNAIKEALVGRYIERVEPGYFDLNAGRASRAAVYALRWADSGPELAPESTIGMKLPAAQTDLEDRYEIASRIGMKLPPVDRCEITSGIEIKQINKTLKQQPGAVATFERLRREGFDQRTAESLIEKWPAERIARQIAWIDRRNAKTNRLGMLRAAIAGDWAEPVQGQKLRRRNYAEQPAMTPGNAYSNALEAARRRLESRHDS